MSDRTIDLRFLRACGAIEPLRLGVDGPHGPEDVDRLLSQPYILVGRGPEADLRLDHPEVSRRHAYLQLIAGRLFCVDLSSRTGTCWETGPAPWGWVDPDRGIRIGPFHLCLRNQRRDAIQVGEAATEPLPTSRAFDLPGLSEVTLEIFDLSVEYPMWRMNRVLVLVGRSQLCKVRLSSPEVSGLHASLVRTTEGVWVVDLNSREGVFVNGQRVRASRLEDGDDLRIGPHQIRLHCSPSEARASKVPALQGQQATWMPSPGPLIGDIVPSGAETLLAPLLRELGQMQRQMADQFQQALMMMFRLFSNMHQDQMSLIREELSQLQQLSQEQQALQARLASQSAATVSGRRPSLRVVSGESPVSVSRSSATPQPTAPQPSNPGDLPEETAAAKATAPPRPTREQVQEAGEIHAMLVKRIAAIQEERQGRWQKLLNAVIGKGNGGEIL